MVFQVSIVGQVSILVLLSFDVFLQNDLDNLLASLEETLKNFFDDNLIKHGPDNCHLTISSKNSRKVKFHKFQIGNINSSDLVTLNSAAVIIYGGVIAPL